MLSKVTGREIADEARMPTPDVILCARDLRWNWPKSILRLDERRMVRQVLLTCVKPAPESLFVTLIFLDISTAIDFAKDRIELKKNKPLKKLLAPLGE